MDLADYTDGNFSYDIFNKNNIEHIRLLDSFETDTFIKFIPDYKRYFAKENDEIDILYIVSLHKELIGFIKIVYNTDFSCVFSHAIAPNYRGNRYSSKIKKEVFEQLFSNKELTEIVCYVDIDNKSNISSILKTNPTSISQDKDNKLKFTYQNPYLKNNTHKK